MSRRTCIHKVTLGDRMVKVFKQYYENEYIVRLYLVVKYGAILQRDADYFTNDREDAISTAIFMAYGVHNPPQMKLWGGDDGCARGSI